MIAVGVLCLLAAFGCTVGFIGATVRADDRLHDVDPAALSRLTGAPLVLALSATLFAIGGVLWLFAAVAGADG